jgi:hypothetical protein
MKMKMMILTTNKITLVLWIETFLASLFKKKITKMYILKPGPLSPLQAG